MKFVLATFLRSLGGLCRRLVVYHQVPYTPPNRPVPPSRSALGPTKTWVKSLMFFLINIRGVEERKNKDLVVKKEPTNRPTDDDGASARLRVWWVSSAAAATATFDYYSSCWVVQHSKWREWRKELLQFYRKTGTCGCWSGMFWWRGEITSIKHRNELYRCRFTAEKFGPVCVCVCAALRCVSRSDDGAGGMKSLLTVRQFMNHTK